ncbi:MAG TPA: hypothetical protein VGT24_04185 [Candidatus Acidoferrales bacterium]|nr:hypothetical protein [Candidatus Acidoferrales bacterium]
MTIKRILAACHIAMLFSAASLGAACEISCGLPRNSSDCHSPLALAPSSAGPGTQMDGMDMSAGEMSMPTLAGADRQTADSVTAAPRAGHPSIGEMGPCERQSCDNRSVASVRSARSNAPQFHSLQLVTYNPQAFGAPPIFRDARDDIAPYSPRDASPPILSLRI